MIARSTALTAVAVVVMAAVCVRLGFWQISRLEQKRAVNAARREAMSAPPVDLGSEAVPLERVRHRRVRVSGRYDEARQILLSGRSRGGSPGVQVVTPLVLERGGAVLVDRGWLFADDAASARPQQDREPGEVSVIGIADSIPSGVSGGAWRTLESDSVTLWSVRRLALDSLRARLPYAVAPYLVRQLPGPGVPPRPVRAAPAPLDESMHVSYAVQWFLFAVILLAGPPIVIRSRRRARGKPTDLEIPER